MSTAPDDPSLVGASASAAVARPEERAPQLAGGADSRFNAVGLVVAALVLINALVWILIPSLLHQAPPRDVIEGYMWGREWVLATYKHPALPSWLIEGSRVVTGGATDWPVYIIAQAITVGCLALVYATGVTVFGRENGRAIGACGALALLPMEHFSWMSPVFNHNLPQMLGWIGVVYFCWRAIEEDQRVHWLLLGFAAAMSLYGKLSSVFLAVGIGAWFLIDPTARRRLATRGPWLALLTLCVLLAPLAIWLVANNFQPFVYAQSRTGDLRPDSATKFISNVVLIQAPLLAVLLMARLMPGQPPRPLLAPSAGADAAAADARHQRGVRYLLCVTLIPVLVPVVFGIVRGSGLRASWLSPAMNSAGLMFVAMATSTVTMAMVRRTALVAGVAGAATATLYAVLLVFPIRSGHPTRVNWPQTELAQRFHDIWQRETQAPLKVVAGDMWVAGLVGYRAATAPSLLTDGDFALSPWVTPERIAREGALVVWHDRGDGIGEALQKLIGRRPIRSEDFRSVRGSKSRPITVRYVIIAPTR